MEINFASIEYLKNGNSRQQQAHRLLTEHGVMIALKDFDPILVGTIPINIDIENSDLDICCYVTDKEKFIQTIELKFSPHKNFRISEFEKQSLPSIVANFLIDDVEIEIFGQSIPSVEQYAYRHMIVEHKILKQQGELFRQQIVELKRQGHKTEPAFGILLGIAGDPYEGLLKYESNTF